MESDKIEMRQRKIEESDKEVKRIKEQIEAYWYKSFTHMQEYLKTIIIIAGALSAFSVTLFNSQYLQNPSLLAGAITWFLAAIILSLFVLKSSIQDECYNLSFFLFLINKNNTEGIKDFNSSLNTKEWRDSYDPADIMFLFLITAISLIVLGFLNLPLHILVYEAMLVSCVLFFIAEIFCRSRKKNNKKKVFRKPSYLLLGERFNSCGIVFMFLVTMFILVTFTILICILLF